MTKADEIDGILVEWGDRLFYPGNRIVHTSSTPRHARSLSQRAAAIRGRIQATVVRRARQVMVKVTGGGRGMGAITAHFRYISRNGRLSYEDDRGDSREGKEALRDLADQWRHAGARIDETSPRREAYNIMLSMPHGTDPVAVQRAAREFAQAELSAHRYVMVLHDDQANPHVHISVRAESRDGKRLNPRKADLQRWRETFAEKLRGWGIDAEASRQATRGQVRNYPPTWRVKAAEEGRLRKSAPRERSGQGFERTQAVAKEAWEEIVTALSKSDRVEDRQLAAHATTFLQTTPLARKVEPKREQPVQQASPSQQPAREKAPVVQRGRPGPEISRGR